MHSVNNFISAKIVNVSSYKKCDEQIKLIFYTFIRRVGKPSNFGVRLWRQMVNWLLRSPRSDRMTQYTLKEKSWQTAEFSTNTSIRIWSQWWLKDWMNPRNVRSNAFRKVLALLFYFLVLYLLSAKLRACLVGNWTILTAYLKMIGMDGITGRVLVSQTYRRARGPCHLIHAENWLMVSPWVNISFGHDGFLDSHLLVRL